MWTILLYVMIPVYVVSCLFLILVILGQEGKGGGLSGLMGSSALGEALGASAAEATLRRWTRNCAIIFISLSLLLTIIGSQVFTGRGSRIEEIARQLPPESRTTPEEKVTSPTVTPGVQPPPTTSTVATPPQERVTTVSVGQPSLTTAPAKPSASVQPATASPSTATAPGSIVPKPVPTPSPATRSP